MERAPVLSHDAPFILEVGMWALCFELEKRNIMSYHYIHVSAFGEQ